MSGVCVRWVYPLYSSTRLIINSLLCDWKCGETQSVLLDTDVETEVLT